MMAEIVRETQNARHVATAYFRGRFADFSIERGRLLDDEDACFRLLALQHQCRRRARKGATDDYHIVFQLHPHRRKWTSKRVKAISSDKRDVAVGTTSSPAGFVSLTNNDLHERA